jgi:hypothetical protein
MKIIIPPFYERKDFIENSDYEDLFGRKKFIENLTTLFTNTTDGLVLTIDSPWGGGKTSLVKIWEKQLKNNNIFIPIYYDAFKNDFTEDPFMSIAVEIYDSLQKKLIEKNKYNENKEQLELLKKNAINIAKDLLKIITKNSISSLTHGIVNNEDINKLIANSTEKILFDTLEYNAEDKFKAHLNGKKNIENYQLQLKKILNLNSGECPQKIIFFVDELDRCRPNFAIEVIEKIKHLFSIDNVFFILTINKKQLIEIVKHNYGIVDNDANNYLQKFVHLETTLPPINLSYGSNDNLNTKIRNFVNSLISLHQIEIYFRRDNNVTIVCIVDILSSFNDPLITPRQIERIFSLITISIGSSEGTIRNDSEVFKLLCSMAILKICLPELYNKWKEGSFVKENDMLSDKIYIIFENNFPKREKIASNVFKIKLTQYVCGILDIYTFYKIVQSAG